MIGLLFGSFGLTLLAVSVPMGAVSDRVGRRLPLVAGMIALALASALFAVARSLPWLFAARLVQGAADGVTWVVGFALIADLYGPDERGRVMGYVMSGTSVALMVGTVDRRLVVRDGRHRAAVRVRGGARVRCARVGFALIRDGAGRREAAAPSAWSVDADARRRRVRRLRRRHGRDAGDARTGAAAVLQPAAGHVAAADRTAVRRRRRRADRHADRLRSAGRQMGQPAPGPARPRADGRVAADAGPGRRA